MKKFLLLLSCCLATWCSVQAGMKSSASSNSNLSNSVLAASYNGDGQIKTASYDANSNTMLVTYSVRYASSVRLRMLQTRTGKIVTDYPLSVNASSTSFRVYTKADSSFGKDLFIDEGLYVLLLVVDGNIRSNMNVQIVASGSIKSFSPSLDNKQLTVSYAMEHASTYGNTIRIYDGNTLLQRISVPYPNTTNSYTFDSSSLKAGKQYRFELYSNNNKVDTKYYTIPLPTGGLTISYTPDNQYSFTVDYNLKYARNPTIGIYDNGGTKLLKSVAITNSSSNKRITISNAVEPNNYYQVYICDNGVKTSIQKPLDTHIVAPPGNVITSITYEKGINRLYTQFSLKKTGVNVGFKVISTRTGKTYDYTFGRCDQFNGDKYLDLPSDDANYRGSIVYVVLLTVNGSVVDSKQIMIAR